jgi:hypothetical protein
MMPETGVSKKLFFGVVCVQAVVGLADGAADKFKYACIIGAIFLIYKAVQGFIDWSKK